MKIVVVLTVAVLIIATVIVAWNWIEKEFIEFIRNLFGL